MDHHCPWLHNCIGFFNRKYFLLLLAYTWITLLLGLAISIYPLITGFNYVVLKKNYKDYMAAVDLGLLILAIIMIIVLFVIMTQFISYHINLVSTNTTTLENLEEQRSGPSVVSYDLGYEFNWT